MQIYYHLQAAGKVIFKAAEYRLVELICINNEFATFSKAARIEIYVTKGTIHDWLLEVIISA